MHITHLKVHKGITERFCYSICSYKKHCESKWLIDHIYSNSFNPNPKSVSLGLKVLNIIKAETVSSDLFYCDKKDQTFFVKWSNCDGSDWNFVLTILDMNSVLIIDLSAYCSNWMFVNQLFLGKYIMCSNINVWILSIELPSSPLFQ